jgi:hypothetical protein
VHYVRRRELVADPRPRLAVSDILSATKDLTRRREPVPTLFIGALAVQ